MGSLLSLEDVLTSCNIFSDMNETILFKIRNNSYRKKPWQRLKRPTRRVNVPRWKKIAGQQQHTIGQLILIRGGCERAGQLESSKKELRNAVCQLKNVNLSRTTEKTGEPFSFFWPIEKWFSHRITMGYPQESCLWRKKNGWKGRPFKTPTWRNLSSLTCSKMARFRSNLAWLLSRLFTQLLTRFLISFRCIGSRA